MSINIKNPEVEAAIRRLASERGVELTEAIRLAVDRELAVTSSRQRSRLRKMRAIADRFVALPILDQRSDNELLGYDENGLPA